MWRNIIFCRASKRSSIDEEGGGDIEEESGTFELVDGDDEDDDEFLSGALTLLSRTANSGAARVSDGGDTGGGVDISGERLSSKTGSSTIGESESIESFLVDSPVDMS